MTTASLSSFKLQIALLLFIPACKHDIACANGTCICENGADCDIECVSPPCRVICHDKGTYCEGECANGECICGAGSECDFQCRSAPCHVDCRGNDWCSGVCANGDCDCSAGSTCVFDCLTGPCHVHCDGNNPQCDGVCANGTCTCGPNSSCIFSCMDADCRVDCEAGAKCVLECPAGNPGEQGCSFSTCASGTPVICADGTHTVCNAECPQQSAL